MKEKIRQTQKTRGANPRTWAVALAVAWHALAYGPAAAQPAVRERGEATRHRVLIITDTAANPLLARVQAELSAVPGLDVITRHPLGSLDETARAEHAEAAIRASGKGVEVWMADATSGRSLLRQLVVDESPNGPDHGLVALQTAELLRTSLLTGHHPPATVPAMPAKPLFVTVTSARPESPIREDAVLAGLGPLWSRGGVGPSWQAWLSYQHLCTRHLGLSLDASLPLHLGSISSSQGNARLGAVTAGAGLLARLESEHSRLAGTATFAVAWASVLSRGEAKATYQSANSTTHTGLVYLRVGTVWRPVGWLGLGAAGLVGTTTSRIRIQFADRTVGDWGTLLLAAVLSGEVAW